MKRLYSKIGNDILHNFKVYNSTDFIKRQKEFLKINIMNMNFKSRPVKKNSTILKYAKELYKLGRLAELSDSDITNLGISRDFNNFKTIKNIKPYGAFVEIGGGVVGLVHIEDLSVARIKTPYERVRIGQKIEVVVKSIDREQGKVILSYKETLGSWEENVEKFTTGIKVKGKVRETEKHKNGIFIELTPKLVGMAEYEEGLQYGQDVEVYIKKIDADKKKVKLLIV